MKSEWKIIFDKAAKDVPLQIKPVTSDLLHDGDNIKKSLFVIFITNSSVLLPIIVMPIIGPSYFQIQMNDHGYHHSVIRALDSMIYYLVFVTWWDNIITQNLVYSNPFAGTIEQNSFRTVATWHINVSGSKITVISYHLEISALQVAALLMVPLWRNIMYMSIHKYAKKPRYLSLSDNFKEILPKWYGNDIHDSP